MRALSKLLALAALLWISAGQAEDAKPGDAVAAEQDLAEVRSRILALEKQVNEQSQLRGAAEEQLKTAERSESKVRSKLRDTGEQLAASRQKLQSLRKQEADMTAELSTHRAELERQIRLAYINGQDGWIQVVMSQRDPAQLGRELVYYSYIARQRSDLMTIVRGKLRELDETTRAVQLEQKRLAAIDRVEQERLAELAETRTTRHLALAEINKGISSQSDQIARLQREAEGLESLVAELTRVLANLPIDDSTRFAERKGRMDWPTDGRLIRKFGQSRADGRLKWDGVLLAAGAGTEVQAIHHGRVVFSDWLAGMGLLVVIEHGDGFLTLYGHNQDVVGEVGEWVKPGTVIAHVGDSGGQATTGLYFEIRKNGQPVDPRQWIGAD